MIFDLRTTQSAFEFVQSFMSMSSTEFIVDYLINCERDFDQFWKKHFKEIDAIGIDDLKIFAFHVTATSDHCEEIKLNGLINLQAVLSTNTRLKHMLEECGIIFDIKEKRIIANGRLIDIDYEKYRGRFDLSPFEEKIERLAHRLYYDYCVNGFLVNDNIFDYGTDIHKRPEFFIQLKAIFPHLTKAENIWEKLSKPYKVHFYATIDQIAPFCFDLNTDSDPPFDDWTDLSFEQRLKKRLLSYAIDRSYGDLGTQFLYIRDDHSIPPCQIISIEELSQ